MRIDSELLLAKLQLKINKMQAERLEILNSLKNRDTISFEEIVTKGQQIDRLKRDIWAIEEAIHG